ncbi:F0F1 ATP synthase subunit delta [Solemya velum gill symbiont]|uniref:ATP synthase subunit delta n=1 Tax=Solemya velum gill symbiont TaxID=2340 RepID=A0A0B0HD44_SOVGS|nr:F0F1 ATP synthase subunit delta [Solemya velum gill symbiont]KHF26522.1 F0F1-type ATP synthase, F1 subunit delta [Solemya velum gill symbiont]OOY52672.1 ATP synthase F1 subunit delta [Solemya velum gill symbiont]OOY65807.1 ATP synthase F1 subunit delta [Solemya velum gill symbiont]OOY67797.1 ATP synthase F1 subunit delta [Solemya velum gill symbiont]OOY70300.1 ATP synthase F1 subunit delta [Solemya velum gill symbiont]
MAQESITIARPYADAIFARAKESSSLEQWSQTLELLGTVMSDAAMSDVVGNPNISKQQLTEMILGIGGEQLTGEAENLVRLLVENGRLVIAPEIATLFEERKNAERGVLEVELVSAYVIDEDQKQALADALKAKLGSDINMTTSEDPELIGGMRIRAGDLVIDGSVQGQLTKLANELGI